jgi:hypothetical protein
MLRALYFHVPLAMEQSILVPLTEKPNHVRPIPQSPGKSQHRGPFPIWRNPIEPVPSYGLEADSTYAQLGTDLRD